MKKDGVLLLQSSLLDHPGDFITKFAARSIFRRGNYRVNGFYLASILADADQAGFDLVEIRRFGLCLPFGDRILGSIELLARDEVCAQFKPQWRREPDTSQKKMMKGVAHLSDSASRLAGGMFESIRGLCGSLVIGGRWQPAMFAAKDTLIEQDFAVWDGIPLDVAARGLRGGFLAHRIARSIEAHAPEIVHLHGLWGPASRAALRLAGGHARPRLVISPRGMLEPWALARSRWKKEVAWHVWGRTLVQRATALHALCDEEAFSLARLAPNVPICVIPNGVYLPELRDSDWSARSRKGSPIPGSYPSKEGAGAADRSVGASSGSGSIWMASRDRRVGRWGTSGGVDGARAKARDPRQRIVSRPNFWRSEGTSFALCFCVHSAELQ